MSTADIAEEFQIPDWVDDSDADVPGPPRPVNWYLLRADELETEWYELDRFVDKIRHSYGLPVSVIPPLWHRHEEPVWELSALHLHWLCAYDPEQNGSAPFGWQRDFEDSRRRLRDWVSACGTRADSDRPTRQANWPGEAPFPEQPPLIAHDRARDFVEYVRVKVEERRQAEEAFYAGLDLRTGEVR